MKHGLTALAKGSISILSGPGGDHALWAARRGNLVPGWDVVWRDGGGA